MNGRVWRIGAASGLLASAILWVVGYLDLPGTVVPSWGRLPLLQSVFTVGLAAMVIVTAGFLSGRAVRTGTRTGLIAGAMVAMLVAMPVAGMLAHGELLAATPLTGPLEPPDRMALLNRIVSWLVLGHAVALVGSLGLGALLGGLGTLVPGRRPRQGTADAPPPWLDAEAQVAFSVALLGLLAALFIVAAIGRLGLNMTEAAAEYGLPAPLDPAPLPLAAAWIAATYGVIAFGRRLEGIGHHGSADARRHTRFAAMMLGVLGIASGVVVGFATPDVQSGPVIWAGLVAFVLGIAYALRALRVVSLVDVVDDAPPAFRPASIPEALDLGLEAAITWTLVALGTIGSTLISATVLLVPSLDALAGRAVSDGPQAAERVATMLIIVPGYILAAMAVQLIGYAVIVRLVSLGRAKTASE
ncbi:MAG: hypothetical protein AAGA48_20135 [Myxococcota bacterium]